MPEAAPSRWDREADVVVVGGGGSGLAAAVEASSLGAKVLLLEKRPQLGGTTSIAVGSFTAPGTSFQRAQSIEDSPRLHDEDMAKFAAGRESKNNPELRLFLAGHAAETLDWLMSLGIQFHGPSSEPPNRVPRMHNAVPNAKAYIAALQRAALRNGAQLLVGLRVRQLFREPDGRVTGLEAAKESGSSLTIRAHRGIILAAGDYSNGDPVKQEFLPPNVAHVEGVNPHATGDGHLLARSVGAELVNMDLVYGPELRFVPPPRPPFAQVLPSNPWLARLFGWGMDLLPKAAIQRIIQGLLVTWQHPETSLLEKGALLINRRGERFCDEAAEPELAIPKQPDKIAYCVFDQKLCSLFSSWPNFISTAPKIAYAYVQDYKRLRPDIYAESETIDGLAQRIGVDGQALKKSIESYNQAARGAAGDLFGRSAFGSPLEQPPFYALGPVKSWLVTTEGGARVNTRMEALDARGQVIPGLYAAGSNGMGGIVIWGHGLHLAWAFTSGRLAGRNAAGAIVV